jgi:pimeloyl-ACP methyl ester carboxylesterase
VVSETEVRPVDIQELVVEANGVEFHCLEVGAGPLALCLHGFPDTAHTWIDLLPALADAGFRAVAPFMRGYSPTSLAPDGRYQSGILGQDACALHEALGGGRPGVIVGHDYGALAAYGGASSEPDRWSRVVAMAVPPALAPEAFFSDYSQIRRSSYMFIFLSQMAEFIVPANDFAFIDGLWADWSPGFDGADDVDHVRAALGPDGRLTAAMEYYRQNLQPELQDENLIDWQEATAAVPPQPTLYLHGRNDGCVGVGLTTSTLELLSEGSQVEIIEGTGHFLHREAPESVVPRIVEFISN